MEVIGRRGFITGLIAIAAAPAIAHADSSLPGFINLFSENLIRGQTYDLRSRGIQYFSAVQCQFECCTFLIGGDNGRRVDLMSCSFDGCCFTGFSKFGETGYVIGYNRFTDCSIDDLGERKLYKFRTTSTKIVIEHDGADTNNVYVTTDTGTRCEAPSS